MVSMDVNIVELGSFKMLLERIHANIAPKGTSLQLNQQFHAHLAQQVRIQVRVPPNATHALKAITQ